ncbi:MAG: hypothetical protein ACLQU9_11120 [Acidimicrobiales bacterium]
MDQSSDEPGDAFEQGDEAIDEESRIDPNFIEEFELDPSLDPTLQVDERELEEAGAVFDDPETKVTLEGGIDDPDGLGAPVGRTGEDDAGWDLDASAIPDGDDGSE